MDRTTARPSRRQPSGDSPADTLHTLVRKVWRRLGVEGELHHYNEKGIEGRPTCVVIQGDGLMAVLYSPDKGAWRVETYSIDNDRVVATRRDVPAPQHLESETGHGIGCRVILGRELHTGDICRYVVPPDKIEDMLSSPVLGYLYHNVPRNSGLLCWMRRVRRAIHPA